MKALTSLQAILKRAGAVPSVTEVESLFDSAHPHLAGARLKKFPQVAWYSDKRDYLFVDVAPAKRLTQSRGL